MNLSPLSALSTLIRLYAKYQRQKGNYSPNTLQAFLFAKKTSSNCSTLFDYLTFKRDLGYLPSLQSLTKVMHGFKNLSERQQFLALNFLIESQPDSNIEGFIHSVAHPQLSKVSPVILSLVKEDSTLRNDQALLSGIHHEQEKWRAEFSLYLNTHIKELNNIVIVGNSAQLKHSQLGGTIDDHRIVCRFNAYPNEEIQHKDVGKKITIWVQSPGLKLPDNFIHPRIKSIKWIVLTGPDVRYTLSDWSTVLPYLKQGAKVLTIPLTIWQPLVNKLQAPPSAGILFTSWVSQLISNQPLSIAGFQSAQNPSAAYHVIKNYKRSNRHNWEKEAEIVRQWKLKRLETVISKNPSNTLTQNVHPPLPHLPVACKSVAIFSSGIKAKKPLIKWLLNYLHVNKVSYKPNRFQATADCVVGWGRKKNTRKARRYAEKNNLPYYSLEDGFLHSVGKNTLEQAGASVVIDRTGMYYDATQLSDLETLLSEGKANSTELIQRARQCINIIIENNLSKYNTQPATSDDASLTSSLASLPTGKKVLLIDQTAGDMSLQYGCATPATFDEMLQAALNEHPSAEILIKTHARVITGKKKSCFNPSVHKHSRVSIIDQAIDPLLLIKAVDHVYVATSQMGFEALMLGKPVTCFGVPFYAQWGLTDDRGPIVSRRNRHCSVEEVFAASYILYSHYIHPTNQQECEIEDILYYFLQA